MKPSITLALFTIAMPWSSVSALANEPLQVGTNKQLFIGPFDDHGRDTHLVESMKNVEVTSLELLARLVRQYSQVVFLGSSYRYGEKDKDKDRSVHNWLLKSQVLESPE